MKATVSLCQCSGYESSAVASSVREAIGLLGGMGKFVRPNSRVLVKPNLLMSKEPECGITTHPELIRAVIRLLKELRCRIYVGDSPSVFGKYIDNLALVHERTGVKELCRQEQVELVDFDKRRWRGEFPLTTWLDNVDHLISIPKFKTHNLTTLTGAIKNLFGLVSGTYKTELHKNNFDIKDFARAVVDICEQAKPSLTIVDAIVAMEGEGPGTSGTLKQLGVILASSDCVALDSLLAVMMGLRPLDIPTTREAAARGLGVADLDAITVVGKALKDVLPGSFRLPSTSAKRKLPQPVIKAVKHLIRYYPYVVRPRCTLCQACIQICPHQAVRLAKEKIVFDYSRCLACFCCQETCPSSAIKVRKSFVAKMVGL